MQPNARLELLHNPNKPKTKGNMMDVPPTPENQAYVASLNDSTQGGRRHSRKYKHRMSSRSKRSKRSRRRSV